MNFPNKSFEKIDADKEDLKIPKVESRVRVIPTNKKCLDAFKIEMKAILTAINRGCSRLIFVWLIQTVV